MNDKFNLTDEQRNGMMRHFLKCMNKPVETATENRIKELEDIIKAGRANSVYVILDDLGEIENIFYDKKKAEKHCEFRNNIAPMSSYIVEKHSVYDADEDEDEEE